MIKLSIYNDIIRYKEGWRLIIKFSDNIYTMIKDSEDILELQSIQSILDNRIVNFFKGNSDILKTSDLGLEYIKI